MDEVATSYLGGRRAVLGLVLGCSEVGRVLSTREPPVEPYLVQTDAKNTISGLKILGLPVKSLTKR